MVYGKIEVFNDHGDSMGVTSVQWELAGYDRPYVRPEGGSATIVITKRGGATRAQCTIADGVKIIDILPTLHLRKFDSIELTPKVYLNL